MLLLLGSPSVSKRPLVFQFLGLCLFEAVTAARASLLSMGVAVNSTVSRSIQG